MGFKVARLFPVVLFLLFLFAAASVSAATLHPERSYQDHWCGRNGGQAEFTLADRTRVDCLTDTHAVEVDFARKWAEAVGQSLFYAVSTGRAPGIVLIMEDPGDIRFLERLKAASRGTRIIVWTITEEDLD